MDRHDLSDEITADHVAHIHHEDLKIEHKYGCKGMTYWFDAERKAAFCLFEAPNKEAIIEMHDEAHGAIPNHIIEVDDKIVESFLGRIEDPEKSPDTELNIINDPAFRTIMVVGMKRVSLHKSTSNQLDLRIQNYYTSTINTINEFNGRIAKQKPGYFLTSFESITNAVLCAVEIQSKLEDVSNNKYDSGIKLEIGLSTGEAVTEKEGIFEDAIQTAERLCDVVNGQIVMTSEVKNLFESENLNTSINAKLIRSLSISDEKLLANLMDFTDKEWSNAAMTVDDFSKNLGYSKSQLYRKMISLTDKSPNTFLQEYRLQKSLELLNKQTHNISEVAFETGFSSPTYFTRVFKKRFGILPTCLAKLSVE
jgi:AraC-like DNA-binding protein